MMKKLTILMMIFIAISCSENNDDNQETAGVNATRVEISITDGNGNDLLDPKNPNAYLKEDVRLYYKVNGQAVEVYDENLTYPRHFFVFQHESEYRIRIFLNENENAAQPITYIKWSTTDTDTLKAEFRRWNNGIQVRKVWFNNEMKWEFSDGAPYFEIVK